MPWVRQQFRDDPEHYRISGSASYVDLFGTRQAPASHPFLTASATLHHIVPIRLLQYFWGAACDANDVQTIKALAKWANASNRVSALGAAAVTRDGAPGVVAAPDGLDVQICWNGFNLIVGPLSDNRANDPGNAFDGIQFQTLPADQNESVARQEFNMHVKRLARIDMYMRRYIEGYDPKAKSFQTRHLHEQDLHSVRELLGSDTRDKYPKLNTGRPGALLHPDLWQSFTLADPPSFAHDTHADKAQRISNRTQVPWVDRSYFPEPVIKPPLRAVNRLDYLLETGTAGLPVTRPVQTFTYGAVLRDPAFLDTAVRALGEIPKRSGLRVFVIGPKHDRLFQDALDHVLTRADGLNKQGCRLRVAPLANRAELKNVEVRLYFL